MESVRPCEVTLSGDPALATALSIRYVLYQEVPKVNTTSVFAGQHMYDGAGRA